MKINLNSVNIKRCLTIMTVSTVAFLGFRVWNSNYNHIYLSSKSTLIPGKSIAPVATAGYSITERQDFGDYVTIDANIITSTVSKKQLQEYVRTITREVKPKARLIIWFYNGNKTLGSYDSRNRDKPNEGLVFGYSPVVASPFPH